MHSPLDGDLAGVLITPDACDPMEKLLSRLSNPGPSKPPLVPEAADPPNTVALLGIEESNALAGLQGLRIRRSLAVALGFTGMQLTSISADEAGNACGPTEKNLSPPLSSLGPFTKPWSKVDLGLFGQMPPSVAVTEAGNACSPTEEYRLPLLSNLGPTSKPRFQVVLGFLGQMQLFMAVDEAGYTSGQAEQLPPPLPNPCPSNPSWVHEAADPLYIAALLQLEEASELGGLLSFLTRRSLTEAFTIFGPGFIWDEITVLIGFR